jgi:hypothetical protein
MVTRTNRLKDFETDRCLGSGLPVRVLAEDYVGAYILPFPCECTNREVGTELLARQSRPALLGSVSFGRGNGTV